jgi:hypothetical protein
MDLHFRNISIPIKSGALITALLMLPNVVWVLLPKAAASEVVSVPPLLSMAERVGRLAVLVLPFFFSLDLHRKFSAPVIVGMGLTRWFTMGAGSDISWEDS